MALKRHRTPQTLVSHVPRDSRRPAGRPVDKRDAGDGTPAYNGPRFGLRRPAELERSGSPMPALPAGSLPYQGSPGGGTVDRADHDRGRGPRSERGSAGRAVRGGGGEAP